MEATRSELRSLADIPVGRGFVSFESFYDSNYRAVLALAIVLTRDRSVADELAQDAFLAALGQWDRVALMDNPGAWVRRVVLNRSVSRFRRGIVEMKALVRLGSAVATPGPEIAESVDLWDAVRRLPRRQAQVIALVYVDDLSRREVAAVLGCSEETVKTHLDRARRALATRLAGGDGS